MAFISWQAFWAMGGYAEYVWPSFIIAVVVMGINIIATRREYKRSVAEAKRHHSLKGGM